MLKKLVGNCARSPLEIAPRWVEHFSLELGGVASRFAALSPLALDCHASPPLGLRLPPSLDDILDVLLASSRGRALGHEVTFD